ncbi:hypothetical protein EVAR_21252_1 [Eumeta japonica]|uniref:Uncharacterized protein n=1 Tax=Eumeta variegata TaxID=151549 RepID=A0A4C1WNN6_EUMVA|nr:hypothetical protein EVAR_21252_1 [Eumeta japonica]
MRGLHADLCCMRAHTDATDKLSGWLPVTSKRRDLMETRFSKNWVNIFVEIPRAVRIYDTIRLRVMPWGEDHDMTFLIILISLAFIMFLALAQVFAVVVFQAVLTTHGVDRCSTECSRRGRVRLHTRRRVCHRSGFICLLLRDSLTHLPRRLARHSH